MSELKDPRPALLGNGEPEEKPRPLKNTPPDMEMGQLAKKITVEREMHG